MTKVLVAASVFALVAASALGQAKTGAALPGDDSKFEAYAGYGLWDPFNNGINGNAYPKLYNPNVTGSLTYYFSRHFGFQTEGSYFSIGRTKTDAGFGVCNAVPCSPVGQRVYTGEGGPVFRMPLGRLVPFAHVLGGGERLSGPVYNKLTWGWTVFGGVGVDYILPYFHNLFAVRPIQADFQYQQVSFGPLYLPANTTGGFASFPSMRLSGGVVVRLGGKDMDTRPHGGLMLGCDAQPSEVYPGDPVQVSANPMNLHPNHPSQYVWNSTGGRITEGESSATIATAGLAPGSYTVTGTVSQGRTHAECTANFTVKPYEPPTVSCQADPSSIISGGSTSITAAGISPSNRVLTYSFAADNGQITALGNRAQLSTAGIPATTITVTCNAVDDLGKTASAQTTVAVTAPRAAAVLPPLATTQALCGISFDRDRRRPVRVDNEAKACLDDVALTLQRQADAKLVIVGDFGAGESQTQGAERSLNVRQYLTDEKGIDPGRIEVRYGSASGRSVENVLVPAGATYTNAQTAVFDPSSVKRVGQAYGKPGAAAGRTSRSHRRRRHTQAATAALPPA